MELKGNCYSVFPSEFLFKKLTSTGANIRDMRVQLQWQENKDCYLAASGKSLVIEVHKCSSKHIALFFSFLFYFLFFSFILFSAVLCCAVQVLCCAVLCCAVQFCSFCSVQF